ncbi:hypothetical protein [Xanthomonas sp. CFBP 8445]|uniref:hypothetical protein n=1 Tax=Xanthomonas sp. CFBP 8445 TaxID=2971236 RepID=UPI00030A8160|nr:hypothetical protein [Xanthomonas sp. CFBP 8445]UYC11196.1 hypothetical protein NUG21_15685 [Xanthomonas sp. CFBP 8445]
MTLPDGFCWETDRWEKDWLRCGRQMVASVSMTAIPEKWIANVNRHDERTVGHPHAYF